MNKVGNIQSLFRKIANGNTEAFGLFFDYTYLTLYRYASCFIDDDDLRKDVVSDVYLYIWQNRMKMDGVRNYQNYIFICVRNQALKYLNYQSKHQKIKLEQTEMRHLSDSATPEQDVLDYELKNIVDLTVDSLPRRCRLIYHTVREGGLKYREVADILSISERTVHAQMCIALKRLGKAVKEYRMCKETVK